MIGSNTSISTAALHTPLPNSVTRKVPPATPVRFPQCAPQASKSSLASDTPLVTLLQTIIRPADIQLSHFEALGIHVISNAAPEDILPDPSFLPPFAEWRAVSSEDLDHATAASKKPLNNGNLSPGIQTYQERRKELSIDNTAAFRTIRRIPAPQGETSVRLGNAYEFFKNLELFSGYWYDTSLPLPTPEGYEEEEKDNDEAQDEATATEAKNDDAKPEVAIHLQTHVRTGTGSQMPADFRQHLISAFLKLVTYDFGCNVYFPRCEPRLFLTPSSSSLCPKPPSYFNSSATFIYRTPTDRASARSGIIEGPLCALSCRAPTVFATQAESNLDFAREMVAILLTAQQRARSTQTEHRFGQDKWWTTVPRWGGGKGGPIGRESDSLPPLVSEEKSESVIVEAAKNELGAETATKRKRERGVGKDGNMTIYENYRKLLPPSSTWDRKARYEAIGRVKGSGWDDVFLVSALNHHVCVMRARVPNALLEVLGGETDGEGWERVQVWRSRWFDLFLVEDRIQGMELVWGMMAWLMRGEQSEGEDTMDLG
jgi:hypothetical protein